MKTIGLFAVLFSFIFPHGLTAQERLDGIAAIVGDEIILHSEVNQFAINLALQMRIDLRNEPEKFEELRKNTLDNLVTQKILLTKAKDDTVTVEDEQVDQVLNDQIQQWIQQFGTEAKVEEYFGEPIGKIKNQFRDEVRDRLMVDRIQQLFAQKINITRPEVEEFYEAMKDSLPDIREMVHISAILREIRSGGAGREAAHEKSRSIRERILAGEDFAGLAKAYSEDPGSAARGGELGMIQRGDFVRDFEEAAFKLSSGEISEIVETKFGLHIIQLIERRGEKINVRHILIQLHSTEEDAANTQEFLAALRDSCLKGAQFSAIAKKYSHDETSVEKGGDLGWFEVDQLQLPEFKQAVQGLAAGDISPPFRTEFGYFIVRLNDRRDAGKLTLEKDWQQLEQIALNQKRTQKVAGLVEELREKIYIEVK